MSHQDFFQLEAISSKPTAMLATATKDLTVLPRAITKGKPVGQATHREQVVPASETPSRKTPQSNQISSRRQDDDTTQ